MFGTAVERRIRVLRSVRIDVESKFSRDHDLIAKRRESFADEFLVYKRPVNLRRVKKRDAVLDRRTDQRDAVLSFDRRPVAKTQPHTAEPDCRYFQIAFSKFSFLHNFLIVADSAIILRSRNSWPFRAV